MVLLIRIDRQNITYWSNDQKVMFSLWSQVGKHTEGGGGLGVSVGDRMAFAWQTFPPLIAFA
jgi:hypothetical protein